MPRRILERILLIEDDLDIRTLVTSVLEMAGGFKVKACASGQEGVREALSFDPDFVLLDVMMPEMDGVMTFNRLRELHTLDDVPIVFMTAKTVKADLDRYRDLSANEVITKPFDVMELVQRIRDLWDRSTKMSDTCRERESDGR